MPSREFEKVALSDRDIITLWDAFTLLHAEGNYVAGVIAGHASKTKKLGFIGAKPIPQVLRNINSFTLGARSVDPSITTQVIFTGD